MRTYHSHKAPRLIYYTTVVTLLIVNSDSSRVPTSTFSTLYQDAGLVGMSYAPPNSVMAFSDWPTLGSMIDAGTRLVTFVSAGVDGTVPYIIDGWLSFGV